jgi:hypothetical protein
MTTPPAPNPSLAVHAGTANTHLKEAFQTGTSNPHVLAECRKQLGRLIGLGRRLTYTEEQAFTDYLVLALLSLLLGPRQEVLAHTRTVNLKAPRSPGNPRDTYYLQVSGHLLKDDPFSGAVLAVLTSAVKYYTQRVRPLTVGGPMFVGSNGLAREDFSTNTRGVTMAVLGKSTTSHRFRHSQITDKLQRAEVNPDVRRDMAAAPRSQRAGPGRAPQPAEAGADPDDYAGRVAEKVRVH